MQAAGVGRKVALHFFACQVPLSLMRDLAPLAYASIAGCVGEVLEAKRSY